MARLREHGLRRSVGVPGLFATAYGNVGSSIYYALGLVAAMKQDAALASIATLGFASHVQTEVITAARQAGVGEVLSRSAFTMQLADILTRS